MYVSIGTRWLDVVYRVSYCSGHGVSDRDVRSLLLLVWASKQQPATTNKRSTAVTGLERVWHQQQPQQQKQPNQSIMIRPKAPERLPHVAAGLSDACMAWLGCDEHVCICACCVAIRLLCVGLLFAVACSTLLIYCCLLFIPSMAYMLRTLPNNKTVQNHNNESRSHVIRNKQEQQITSTMTTVRTAINKIQTARNDKQQQR